MAQIFPIALTLFFLIDALGHIPAYLAFLKNVSAKRRRFVIVRELLIAFVIMVAFQLLGIVLFPLLSIQKQTVHISGGIVLFLISLRLIFQEKEVSDTNLNEEPFIVPIATPLIAGPSVLAIIMIYSQEATPHLLLLEATFLAWLISSLIFLAARPIFNLMGEKGLIACQRLMGLVVSLIAVQMFVNGIVGLIKSQT